MSETYNDQPLIRETFLHTRELDAHARRTLEAQGVNPHDAPVVYMDNNLNTIDLDYRKHDYVRFDRIRTALTNGARHLIGLDGTIGHSAIVDRKDLATGNKTSLYLRHSLGYHDLSDTFISAKSRYHMHLTDWNRLDEADPRIKYPRLGFEEYEPSDRKLTLEDQEAFLHDVLALTPDHLYISEERAASPEQQREVAAEVKENVVELFSKFNIDVHHHKAVQNLSFKIGDSDAFSRVSFRYNPTTLAKLSPGQGSNYTPIGPRGVNGIYSPTVFASLEHNGGSINFVVPFHDLMGSGLHLSATSIESHPGDSAELKTYAELSYVAKIVETLNMNADYGMVGDTYILDPTSISANLEDRLQPIIPEPIDLPETVTEFIKKRT